MSRSSLSDHRDTERSAGGVGEGGVAVQSVPLWGFRALDLTWRVPQPRPIHLHRRL